MLIADVALIDGIATNGVVVNAYRAARFSGIPALNAAPPGGAPDAGPVTSGTIFGGVGNFEITTPTAEAYYLSAVFGGQTAWQLYSSISPGASDAATLCFTAPQPGLVPPSGGRAPSPT